MRILLLLLGGLLLGGAAHLAQVADQGWLPIGPQAEGHVSALALGPDGTLYAGTQNGELYTRAQDTWLPTADAGARVSDAAITALFPAEPFYIGTTDGVLRLDEGVARPVTDVPATPVREFAPDGADGVLLVTVQGALYHAPAGDAWRAFSNEGLPQAPVYRLLADQGRLYAGTMGGGVYVRAGDAWAPLNDGLPPDIKVYALWPLETGGLVAGTDAGAWLLGRDGRWRRLGVGLDRQRVLDLAVLDQPEGDYLLAASDEALWRLPLDAGAHGASETWWTATRALVPLAAPVARTVVADGQAYLTAGPVYHWASSRAGRLGVALLGGAGLLLIIIVLWRDARTLRR